MIANCLDRDPCTSNNFFIFQSGKRSSDGYLHLPQHMDKAIQRTVLVELANTNTTYLTGRTAAPTPNTSFVSLSSSMNSIMAPPSSRLATRRRSPRPPNHPRAVFDLIWLFLLAGA